MKCLTLFFALFLVCPLPVRAQSSDALLAQVADALSGREEAHALTLFRQAVAADADKAEHFYRAAVDQGTPAAPRLAGVLAAHYKDARNYDKAYLFYQEFLQHYPCDVAALVACAEVQLMREHVQEARKTYEQLLVLDADNLPAHIFLGNYYYLRAEQARVQLEAEYRKIAVPTRMQYARYRNELSGLLVNGYARAKSHLQQVLRLFPSTEAGYTLEKIKLLEQKLE